MIKPDLLLNIDAWRKKAVELWGRHQIFTTAPALAAMKVGELAFGDGTESSPAAGSDAIYFKPDASKICVIATNGTNSAVRNIT